MEMKTQYLQQKSVADNKCAWCSINTELLLAIKIIRGNNILFTEKVEEKAALHIHIHLGRGQGVQQSE